MPEFRITRRADALIPDTSHLEAVNAMLSAEAANLAGAVIDLQIDILELKVENRELREFARTVVALCEPMDPHADSPIPEPIRTVLLNLATRAL